MIKFRSKFKFKKDKKPKGFISFFGALKHVGTFVIVLVGYICRVTYSNTDTSVWDLVGKFLQQHAHQFYFWSSLVLVISIFMVYVLNRQSGWSFLKVLINEFNTHVYQDRNTADKSFHRVTLFQHKKLSFFKGRIVKSWLVPKVRSGTMFQNTTTYFLTGNRPEACEGLSGKAWHEESAEAFGLPDITSKSVSNEDIQAYSNGTYTNQNWVIKRHEKLFSRSFYAVRIEGDNEPWGVLVLDSKSPTQIPIKNLYKDFPVFLKMMSKVIKDFKL